MVAYKTLSTYFIQVLSFVTLVHITQTANQDWSKLHTAFTKQLQNFPVSASLPKFDVKIIAAKDNRRVPKNHEKRGIEKKRGLGSGESRIIFLPERSSICQYPPKISAINIKKQSRARLRLAHPMLYILKIQKTYGIF